MPRGDLADRFRHYTSRVNFGDRALQLTVASILLVIALIGAIVNTGSDSTEDGSTLAGESNENVPTAGALPTVGPLDIKGGATAGPGGTSSGTVTDPGGGDTGGAAVTGKNARGVTDKEIVIGAAYDRNAGGLNKALGIQGVGQIDGKRAVEVLRDHYNKRGGIAGRKIRIVFHEFDSLSGQTLDQISQQICTTFTQDNKVFAAFAGGPDTLNTCLNKAGVVQVGSAGGLSDSQTYRQFPLMMHINGPGMDRMAKFYVDQLHARGYYSRVRQGQPKAPIKIGVVSWDDPVFDRAIEAFRKALAVHGLKLSAVAQPHRYQSEAEIVDSFAGIRSAVVKFKTEGITHVQFLSTSNAIEQLIFYQDSDLQQYYPRYGLTSIDGSQAIIPIFENASGKGAAARTFTDSVGIGWNPLFDVTKAEYTGSKELAKLRECKSILKHETYDDPARNKEVAAGYSCDGFAYVKAALEKPGTSFLNQKTWVQGAEGLGSLESAITFDMGTRVGRHDGMNAVRDMLYFPNCNCFKYTSGQKKV